MRRLLAAIIAILVLFAVCAALEKEVSLDGTATQTEAIWTETVNSLSDAFGQIKDGISTMFSSISDKLKSDDSANTEIGEISVDQLPEDAQEYYYFTKLKKGGNKMIFENVFLAEIQLENGDVNEFIDKCWYALNIHKAYPDEKIGNNAFRDWVRDLGWITQKTVIVLIKGKVQDSTRRTLETINNYWEKQFYKTDGKPEYEKKVDFIIVS